MFRYILNFQHIQSLLNFAFTIKRPCKRLIFAWSQLFDYIFKNGNDLHAYYITAYVYFKEGHRCRFPSYINGAALNARHRKDLSPCSYPSTFSYTFIKFPPYIFTISSLENPLSNKA